MSDKKLMDELKREAAQLFNNQTMLLLEELFRRYNKCRLSQTINQMNSQNF